MSKRTVLVGELLDLALAFQRIAGKAMHGSVVAMQNAHQLVAVARRVEADEWSYAVGLAWRDAALITIHQQGGKSYAAHA